MTAKYFTDLATGGARGGLTDEELVQGYEHLKYPEDVRPLDADLDRKPPPVAGMPLPDPW